jgi:hypothetical protein
METRFGRDLSQVRIHTDPQAAESARQVDAQAYTVGPHIAFAEGFYRPASSSGQGLLAHELTHVLQQSRVKSSAAPVTMGEPLAIGERDNSYERQAQAPGQGGVQSLASPILQRQTFPVLFPPLASDLPKTIDSAEFGSGGSLAEDDPQVIRLAEAYKKHSASHTLTTVKLSAYLSNAAKNASAVEQEERRTSGARMRTLRDSLARLGVPRDKVSIFPASAYYNSQAGKVIAEVIQSAPMILPAPPMVVPPGPAQVPPASGGGGLPSIGDKLKVKFGPVEIDIPKSVTLKLPIALSAAKTLNIELKGEAPATFSFSLWLDGLQYIRIGLKAGVKYDPKKESTTGSAGLEIELQKKTCSAANPNALRAKITKAGEELTKAGAEFNAATTNEDKLSKAADVASALADMYDAVDQSTKACTPKPAASFRIGVEGPLGKVPGEETDPSKRPPSYLGGTLTIPF